MRNYIIRFDDLCSTMDWDKFERIKKVLEKNNIKSVLGVVPSNKDSALNISDKMSEELFYNRVHHFKNYGDTIAQHGLYHILQTCSGGILKINKYGEICDLPYEKQVELLKKGKELLIEKGVWEPYYMAPAHSFDENTLRALEKLEFVALTDGWGGYPYKLKNIICVPQLFAKPFTRFNIGYQTICLHTNNMTDSQINSFINFVESNKNNFVDFKDIINNSSLLKFNLRKSALYYSSKFLIPIIRTLRK